MHEGVEVRAVRYRVLPGTQAKARYLNRIAGACRYVWNVTLDDQQVLHDTARMFGASAPSPTFFTLSKGFTDLRNSNGHEWLKELPFTVVRYTLKRQARGGGRRRRTGAKLSRTCRRIAGVRANWCHQASRRIADVAHTVVVEDLNTKGMTRFGEGLYRCAGNERQGQVGIEPGHPVKRMGGFGAEPGLQGGAGCWRQSRPHVADLSLLRYH